MDGRRWAARGAATTSVRPGRTASAPVREWPPESRSRRWPLRRESFEADPWIEHPVCEIGDEVHRDVGHRDEQDAALHERIVARVDRLNQQAADAGPREDGLGDDRAREHRAELEADDRHDRNEAVAERMA